ncbi:MAG: hypothetical protein CM15mP55_1260 [Hyphomicrobiales bacterium]|nr:MAG: hypothetical protein CM15mP55_1260 [Hyphomicrobiales bacterium]
MPLTRERHWHDANAAPASVENLHVGFTSDGRQTTAVDGVSFEVPEGKTLGLVGESGSGKSVSALSVLGLLPYPAAFHNSGRIMFDGDDIMGADTRVLQRLRARHFDDISGADEFA